MLQHTSETNINFKTYNFYMLASILDFSGTFHNQKLNEVCMKITFPIKYSDFIISLLKNTSCFEIMFTNKKIIITTNDFFYLNTFISCIFNTLKNNEIIKKIEKAPIEFDKQSYPSIVEDFRLEHYYFVSLLHFLKFSIQFDFSQINKSSIYLIVKHKNESIISFINSFSYNHFNILISSYKHNNYFVLELRNKIILYKLLRQYYCFIKHNNFVISNSLLFKLEILLDILFILNSKLFLFQNYNLLLLKLIYIYSFNYNDDEFYVYNII